MWTASLAIRVISGSPMTAVSPELVWVIFPDTAAGPPCSWAGLWCLLLCSADAGEALMCVLMFLPLVSSALIRLNEL